MRRGWPASLAVLCCAACSHAGAASPPPTAAVQAAGTFEASRLGTGDVFEVRVFQEPDLSGIYRVASDGSIEFPLCGKIVAGGFLASEVAQKLTTCLAAGYLKNTQVSLFVREYNSKKVFVLGEVQKPGTFSYEDNMTVVQAITLAGGFSPHADRNASSVARLVAGREQRYKVPVVDIGLGRAENFPLQPGDIIFVPESLF